MKLLSSMLTVTALILFMGCSGQDIGNKEVKLNNTIDSVSYSLGINIAENVKAQGMKEINAEAVAKGFQDVFSDNETMLDAAQAGMLLNTYFQNMQTSMAEESMQAGEDFLAENMLREEVVTTESGLQYEVLTEGTGPIPEEGDQVRVHYHGMLIDSTVFDSSVDRGEPVTFGVTQVIPGWQEALQLMPVGSKWKIYIPSELAYGERGAGQVIGPNEALIFEVELLGIEEQQDTGQ
mgnify:CR=1 FL=1